MADDQNTGWNIPITRLDEVPMSVGVDHDLSVYTSGLTYYISDSTPTVVATVTNASITRSDPRGLGYNTHASWSLNDDQTNLGAGKYTHQLVGNTGSSLITLADGTLVVSEIDAGWTDIVISPANMKVPPSSAPTEVTWLSVFKKYSFDQGEYLQFEGLQLPHGYVPGTDLHPHVHFTPDAAIADGETVMFTIDYTAASYGHVFPAASSVTCTFTNDAATRAALDASALSGTSVVANAHLIAAGATIDGAGFTLSAVLDGILTRSASDTFTGEVLLVSGDAHAQINRFGSSSEYTG